MATYLPEEVVVKILSRLPPKSLIRFKCVSKRWHALIGNPDFLSKHLLNHSIIAQNPNEDDPLRLILFFAHDSDTGNLIHSFRYYDSLHCASQTPLNLPTEATFDIVASCNGLLCLWDYARNDIYLWNPATSSELKALPASSSYCRLRVLLFHVGFGFDSVSNDYKVIRILLVEGEDDLWDEVDIYSLRCGSWRQLDVGVPLTLIYDDWRSAALDGVFLWYGDDEYKEHSEIIVAFDFSNEEFRTMLFPDFCDYGECTRTVTELKGSLAMLVFPNDDGKKHMYLDIWVMLEFGVRESWTRLLSINLPVHLERPLGFWKNGELFMENRKRQLVLYDLLTQTAKELQFKGSWGTFEVVELRVSSIVINGGVELGGMESGVISTPSCSSCSSQLHYATDFNNHEDCRRKQQETDRKLEETQISLQETQISLQDMQERTAKMEEGMAKMREKMDMLMALASRPGGSFGGDPSQDNL
ncbi:F-box/kelch-repeat protein At3g23880-like [Corylus avellana]|uniref:F-box/kelch-repeat protein At3g23880-like n=1 Tax=Corylus avellana TaxID=13451 RepID=UPI001E21D70F|nr:F-box/kelch-repeat protein At3g23880-like [Corylus avellana]